MTTGAQRDPEIEPDEESLGSDEGRGRIRQLVEQELGEEWAQRFSAVWQRLDEWDLRHNVSEGLRERKKRQTRQRISDIATAMFLARGFDAVKVAEIADEGRRLREDDLQLLPHQGVAGLRPGRRAIARLAAAVRDRPAGVIADRRGRRARRKTWRGSARPRVKEVSTFSPLSAG